LANPVRARHQNANGAAPRHPQNHTEAPCPLASCHHHVPDRLAGYLCLYRAYDMRFLIRLLALFALFALLALLAFCQAHF
jgi:hypothetical protein